MSTKENLESKILAFEKPMKMKPKSLRPMRSLLGTRSFKPKTTVANMILVKNEELVKRD
jgi:hypothetical protein